MGFLFPRRFNKIKRSVQKKETHGRLSEKLSKAIPEFYTSFMKYRIICV